MSDALIFPDSFGGGANVLPPAFKCSWTNGELDAAWVRVAGELDIATAPQLLQTLREPELQARLIVLDLRELAFSDSSGVHAIVDASICARKGGRRLVLLRAAPNVDRMFRLTACSDEVEIIDLEPVERAS